MNQEKEDELLMELRRAHNFMIGMSLDLAVPPHAKQALTFKAIQILDVINKHTK